MFRKIKTVIETLKNAYRIRRNNRMFLKHAEEIFEMEDWFAIAEEKRKAENYTNYLKTKMRNPILYEEFET
jgi:extradiol dioxygenase family protein